MAGRTAPVVSPFFFHTTWYSLHKWSNMQIESYSKLGFLVHFMGSILIGSIFMESILIGFILTKYASYTFLHLTVQVWNIKGLLYVQRHGIGKLEFECWLKGSAHCSVPFKGLYMHTFRQPFLQRWHCPINNSTLETLKPLSD